jgi:transposase
MKLRQVEKIDLGSCTVSLWLWKGEKRGRILRPKKQRGARSLLSFSRKWVMCPQMKQ